MYRVIENKTKHQYAVWSWCKFTKKGKSDWIRISSYYFYPENAENYAKLLAQANLEAQL